MKMDWKSGAIVVLAMVMTASLLAPVAGAAMGGGGMGAGMGGVSASSGPGGAMANAGMGTIASSSSGLGGMNLGNHGFAGDGMAVGVNPGFNMGINRGFDVDRGFINRGFDRDDFRFNNFGFSSFGGGFYPWWGAGYGYPYNPAPYGGNQGACYQSCLNSGQYSPAQCGQMCYNPY